MANLRDFKNKNTVFSGTDSIVVPVGTTGQRLGTELGQLRYNTTTGLAEFYTITGWTPVDAPPTVSGISGTINENTSSTITVTGTNFKSGSTINIIGSAVSNIERPLATTYINQTTLTTETNAASVNFVGGASFGVRVVNPSGLAGTLDPAGTIDRDPVWSTASGSLGSFSDGTSVSVTLLASDPDGSSVTYSLQSGTLPSGLALNSSSGVISGTASVVANDTTSSFTIRATSNSQTADRAFSITITASNFFGTGSDGSLNT